MNFRNKLECSWQVFPTSSNVNLLTFFESNTILELLQHIAYSNEMVYLTKTLEYIDSKKVLRSTPGVNLIKLFGVNLNTLFVS
jgi:hypothetical protein